MKISLKYDNCVIKSLVGYSVKYYCPSDLGSLSFESACPSFGQSNQVTRPLSSVKDEWDTINPHSITGQRIDQRDLIGVFGRGL